MIMRSVHRRRLPRLLNTLGLMLLSIVLFTPKMDSWPTDANLVVTLFAPSTSAPAR